MFHSATLPTCPCPSLQVVSHGFTPIMTPDLVKESVLEKCGFQPRGTNTQVRNMTGWKAVRLRSRSNVK